MSEHGHACTSCGTEEVRDSENLNRLANAIEDLVSVVRESVRIPVVLNITGEKISHERVVRITEQLRQILSPAAARTVDLTPEAVPHD